MTQRNDRLLRVLTDVEARLRQRQERANLSFEIRQLMHELEFLQDQVEVLEEERASLESQLQVAEPEREASRAEFDRLKAERDEISVSGNIEDLSQEIEAKIREMARLEVELADLEAEVPQKLTLAAESEAELDELLGRHQAVEARVVQLRQEVSSREQSLGILSYINVRLGAWIRLKRPDLIGNAQGNPDTLREFIEDMRMEVESGNGDLATMTAELQELQSEEKKFIFNRQRLDAQLLGLSSYLEESESVESLSETLERLTREREEMDGRILSAREELAIVEFEDEKLAQELEHAEAELQQARTRQAALEATRRELRSEAEPEEAIRSMNAQAESLRVEVRINRMMLRVVDGIVAATNRSNERIEAECARRRACIGDISRLLPRNDV